MSVYIKKFKETRLYEQESGPNVSYHAILPKGMVDKISMGWVKLKGPTYTVPNKHMEWEQCYVILSGKGTIHLGSRSYPIEGKMIVKIPYNTEHYVRVPKGEELEYVYVNSFFETPAS